MTYIIIRNSVLKICKTPERIHSKKPMSQYFLFNSVVFECGDTIVVILMLENVQNGYFSHLRSQEKQHTKMHPVSSLWNYVCRANKNIVVDSKNSFFLKIQYSLVLTKEYFFRWNLLPHHTIQPTGQKKSSVSAGGCGLCVDHCLPAFTCVQYVQSWKFLFQANIFITTSPTLTLEVRTFR